MLPYLSIAGYAGDRHFVCRLIIRYLSGSDFLKIEYKDNTFLSEKQ